SCARIIGDGDGLGPVFDPTRKSAIVGKEKANGRHPAPTRGIAEARGEYQQQVRARARSGEAAEAGAKPIAEPVHSRVNVGRSGTHGVRRTFRDRAAVGASSKAWERRHFGFGGVAGRSARTAVERRDSRERSGEVGVSRYGDDRASGRRGDVRVSDRRGVGG